MQCIKWLHLCFNCTLSFTNNWNWDWNVLGLHHWSSWWTDFLTVCNARRRGNMFSVNCFSRDVMSDGGAAIHFKVFECAMLFHSQSHHWILLPVQWSNWEDEPGVGEAFAASSRLAAHQSLENPSHLKNRNGNWPGLRYTLCFQFTPFQFTYLLEQWGWITTHFTFSDQVKKGEKSPSFFSPQSLSALNTTV